MPDTISVGRRIDPLVSIAEMEPGDYGRKLGTSNWWVRLPNGDPIKLDWRWNVQEHGDGSITVTPSIDVFSTAAGRWHGHLRGGVFTNA